MDILYGDVNPSGRLTHTIAKNESDYNVAICETVVCNFTEGNLLDYKYFDAADLAPRYEFGFGLSYTSFAYSALEISTNATALANTYPTGILSVGGKADLWDQVATASLTIANNGTRDGAEVAQLYISFPEEAAQPIRVLRGFERVTIATGAETTVSFGLKRRDLSFWDTAAQEWAIARGNYTLSVGASSRDLRVVGELVV